MTLIWIGAAILGVIGFLLLIPMLVIAGGMWSAWWLHPIYMEFVPILDLPAITYWQFVALKWFLSVLMPVHVPTYEPTETKFSFTMFGAAWLAPMIIYYLVRWAL